MTEEPVRTAGRRRWPDMNRRGFVRDMTGTVAFLALLAAVSFGVYAFVGWRLGIIAGEEPWLLEPVPRAAHAVYSVMHAVIPWFVGLLSAFCVGGKLGAWNGRRYEQQVAGA